MTRAHPNANPGGPAASHTTVEQEGHTSMNTLTTARELQRTAARVLHQLLEHTHLPAVRWHLSDPSYAPHIYTAESLHFQMLSGQTTSHQTVRDWATHLDVPVTLLYEDTPNARAVVSGIVVSVWCDPKYRDDVDASEE